jgi:Phosphatidylinositol 3- and 4-kinase/PH domain
MEKVVMIIWQFRDDPQVVKFMTRFVSKFAGSRHVFDGIEFYLPQLAHMIIHLEAEWDDAILERFALVIAQQSMHFALQLNWILQGAIEDYQPELPDGSANPDYHPVYYLRCIKLLKNMERCVVYRKPRSAELQALYEKGKITKQEMQQLEQADRTFQALQTAGMDNDEGKENFGGDLLYKRAVRTACYKPKPWKTRYFAIQENMLNCYNSQGGRLVRSMPLEGAEVKTLSSTDHGYKNMFSVSNRSFEFRMRAASKVDMTKWVKILTNEAESRTVFGHMDASVHKANVHQDRLVSEMTPGQRARFTFFRDEREFVRRLTDIAEELRFKEPADRKRIAPTLMRHLEVKSCVYSPLCGSTEVWRRIHGVLYKDTRVFNTKERCPVIMYFLAARGEIVSTRKGGLRDVNLDVTEYMHLRYDKLDDEPLESHEEDVNGEDDLHDEDLKEDPVSSSVWQDSVKGEGTGHGRSHFNESFSSIPRNLAARLEGRNRRRSYLSNSTALNHVPILEGQSNENILPVAGGISVGTSSILSPESGMITGEANTGEIGKEYINKAKDVVSGGESWAEKSKRMLEEAKFKPESGELEVVCLMAKSNDDLRQEVFIMQMIHYYKSVFAKANIPVWLKTYRILSTSSSTGLIEVLVDATSLDGLKKSDKYPYEDGGMRAYFEKTYGGPTSKAFAAAQRNFMQSLAGYSIISYLLGLKDRHNGNIMIDTSGHLMHIDFGFVMGMAPGNDFSMERAPFKLTKEYVDVMGGLDSACYKEYERLVIEGFKEARKSSQIALGLVEIMMYKSKYPCFIGKSGNGVALKKFERRLMLHVPDSKVEKRAKALIEQSYDHWGTNFYDQFQQWSNGYAI